MTEPIADAAVAGTTDITGELGVSDGDHIIGVSFEKVTRAEEVLLALSHLQGEGEIAMHDAVVVVKTAEGKVRIHQTVDPTPGRSALTGSIWGMLAGLLFGGPIFLAAAAAGAGGGALLAKLIDLGLDDKWVKEVGEWLDPGTSALLVLVAAEVRPAVVAELGRYEGTVLYCTFPDAVRQELERALSDPS
ncbi:DUF1269 domain-containing protein [Aquihabitans sp. McL0605]|uniref:DUF1269 domain-containing protein n=1 Tax=Aquihabitans sp. McL0605 TaxID=3415671 RepID=UPI003CF94EDB